MNDKNKVCIVTWANAMNYGTDLQAFALLKKLELMGYDVKLKGSITNNVNYFLHPIYVIRRLTKKLKRKAKHINIQEKDKLKEQRVKDFCSQYLPTLNCNGRKEWKRIEEEYIAFITGSDQVWNPDHFHDAYMLDFIMNDKIKKISYAPSIGVNTLSKSTRSIYKRLLSSYSAISVRETQSAKLIEDISPVPVQVVIDPTLLLTGKDYDKLADTAQIDKTITDSTAPYILCYFVGKLRDYSDIIKRVQNMTGFRCIIIPMGTDLSSCGYVATGVGPKEFLWLIKNASIVLTDSFHGTAFSIIYKREFYVFKRFKDNSSVSQNGRIYDILNRLKLNERLISDETQFERNTVIDWNRTYQVLDKEREHSTDFLINSLKN